MKRILCLLLGVILILYFASPSLAGKGRRGGNQGGNQFDFKVEIGISPNPVCIGDEVTVSATITNTGKRTDEYQITGYLLLDTEEKFIGEVFVELRKRESKTFSITQVIPPIVPPDTYTVLIIVKSLHGGIEKTCTPSLTVEDCDGDGCMDNSECGPDEFCQKPVGECGEVGICSPRPDVCPPLDYYPVCGCDGETYYNPCEAAMVGVSIAYPWPCDDVGVGVEF